MVTKKTEVKETLLRKAYGATLPPYTEVTNEVTVDVYERQAGGKYKKLESTEADEAIRSVIDNPDEPIDNDLLDDFEDGMFPGDVDEDFYLEDEDGLSFLPPYPENEADNDD